MANILLCTALNSCGVFPMMNGAKLPQINLKGVKNMISKQELIYKGIREIPAGSFTNEKGELINYNEGYKFRFEMIYNGLPQIFEIKCTKDFALNCAKNTKINDKLNVTFVFNIFPNGKIDCKIQSIEKI